MNRIFRLVFNHALGLWQVASELVKSPRGSAKGGGGAMVATLPPLRFAMYLALGFVTTVPAFAQAVQGESHGRILADRNAPGNQRPTLVEAPNGTPVVNIQTPSAAGVSRNTYSQFDVGSQGAILNNSRSNAVTQLGGGIAGNPWLARGTAKVILNEVNGPASRLNGYVEVGGDRAQVIIANPAGIQVNGGGFLNASRVTLTTGKPIFTGGNLDGYRVEGGAIRINGAGLDATHTDYTDLIARSLEVNAGVWAKQLQATLGANIVSADHAQVAAIGSVTAAPQFALDVSALGGMYANKIRLIGNEHGVGVRNAGRIGAMADDLTVTADGHIVNTGTIQARRDAHIDASGAVANAGTISASRELILTTPAELDNSGGTLNARRIEASAEALRNRDGAIEQTGVRALALHGKSISNRDDGRIGLAAPVEGGSTGGGSTGTAPGGSSDGSSGGGEGGTTGGTTGGGSAGDGPISDLIALADGALRITGALDNDGGKINAGGGVGVHTATGINNDGGHLGLGQLTITQGELSNAAGELIVSGDASVHATRIVNDAGRLEIVGAMDLAAQSLSNRGGALVHGGASQATIAVAGTFDNTDGTLASNASRLAVNADALVNERGTIQHAGADGLFLQIGNAQANAAARLTPANGAALLPGASVFSPGAPPPGGSLLGAEGRIVTGGALILDAGNIDHRDATMSAAQITVTAKALDNSGGQLIASGTEANMLSVSGLLDNTEGNVASSADLTLSAGSLDNTYGKLQHAGTGAFTLVATRLYGTGGALLSNGALGITGHSIGLDGGTTQANQIGINADEISNRGGKLTAFGATALSLTARDAFDNTYGTVTTNGALVAQAGELVNADGAINAAGLAASVVTVDGTLDNAHGTLATAGALGVKAGTLINRDTRTRAGEPATTGLHATELNVDATAIDNAHGQIGASGPTRLKADSLTNTDGAITARSDLNVNARLLQGEGGTLGANGGLTLTGSTLNLREGTTFARSISIDSDRLTTAGGTLTATGPDALSIAARDTLDNIAGAIQGNGALHVTAGTLINRDTRAAEGAPASGLLSAGAMTLDAQRIDNTSGLVATGAAATVKATDLINQGGVVQAGSALMLTAEGLLDNRTGLMSGTEDTTLTAATLDNRGGTIQHAGAGTLAIDATTLNGSGGTIASNGALSLTGTSTDLRDATTFAQAISVDTTDLTTAAGTLSALGTGTMSLTARGTLDNTAGTIQGNGSLAVTAGTLINRDTRAAQGQPALGLLSAGAMMLEARRIDNAAGLLATGAAATVKATDLINQGGAVQASGALAVTTTGRLDNRTGLIAGTDDTTLTAATLDNTGGTIQHAGDGTLAIAATALIGSGGTIASNGALSLTGTTTLLRNATTSAQTITVDTTDLTTAGGKLTAAGTDALRITARGTLDNTAGVIQTNGTLDVTANTLINRDTVPAEDEPALGLLSAGAMQLRIADGFDNSRGTLAAAGAMTVRAGSITNAAGTIRAASDQTLSLTSDGRLANDGGTIAGNGVIALAAQSMSNADGTVRSQRAVSARVAGTLNTTAGTIASGDALSVNAATLLNRDTYDATARTNAGKGLFGHTVTLDASMLDNTLGQIQANQSLSLTGRDLDNADGAIGGAGAVAVNATSFNNTGGQLVQYAHDGTLSITTTGALTNVRGQIGSLGTADLRADSLDNSAGTGFGWHGLTVRTEGDAINRNGGFLSAGQTREDGVTTAAANVRVGGLLDNSGGSLDATGALTVDAAGVVNAGGQIMAGTARAAANAQSVLTLTTASSLDRRGGVVDDPGSAIAGLRSDVLLQEDATFDNRSGMVANRGGDVLLQVEALNNTALNGGDGGRVVATRDLTLTTNAVNNNAGSVFAHRTLRYENAAGTLDNGAGKIGAGENATLNLARIDNAAGGVIDAGTLWLTTRNLRTDGEVSGDTVHAQLTSLSGSGRLHGRQQLDVDMGGDFAYGSGPRLESDVLLDLSVAGTFTNSGKLQTPGELALTATRVINNGTIDASSADGSGYVHIAAGTVQNNRDASLEGDKLELAATTVTNTGNIIAGGLTITADTLTNGRDLGTALAAVNYAEGFIGASESLDISADRLANRDGDIFSAGELTLGGRDAARALEVTNVSGRIQAEGDASISADMIRNERRMLAVESYTLSADEAYALGSKRRFDQLYAAMSAQDRADFDRLSQIRDRTPAQEQRLAQLVAQLGWSREQISAAMWQAAKCRIQSHRHRRIRGGRWTPGGKPGQRVGASGGCLHNRTTTGRGPDQRRKPDPHRWRSDAGQRRRRAQPRLANRRRAQLDHCRGGLRSHGGRSARGEHRLRRPVPRRAHYHSVVL
jgi:filamentous hemagglutinin